MIRRTCYISRGYEPYPRYTTATNRYYSRCGFVLVILIIDCQRSEERLGQRNGEDRSECKWVQTRERIREIERVVTEGAEGAGANVNEETVELCEILAKAASGQICSTCYTTSENGKEFAISRLLPASSDRTPSTQPTPPSPDQHRRISTSNQISISIVIGASATRVERHGDPRLKQLPVGMPALSGHGREFAITRLLPAPSTQPNTTMTIAPPAQMLGKQCRT